LFYNSYTCKEIIITAIIDDLPVLIEYLPLFVLFGVPAFKALKLACRHAVGAIVPERGEANHTRAIVFRFIAERGKNKNTRALRAIF